MALQLCAILVCCYASEVKVIYLFDRLDCIDRNMAFAIMCVIDCTSDILTKMASIIIVIPGFLLAAAPISVLFFLIGKFYTKSSRDPKRLELDEKSSIFQLFHESCNGIESIRDFRLQGSCLEDLLQRFHAFISKRSLRCARNRWMIIHLQFIGALVCFFIGSFAISYTETSSKVCPEPSAYEALSYC